MPTYELTIDGVVKAYNHPSLTVNLVGNGRDVWACELVSLNRAYVPQVGDPAALTEDSNYLIEGFLDTIDEQSPLEEPVGNSLYRLTFVGQDVLASRRVVISKTFPIGTSLKAIADSLVSDYLDDFGVTSDPTTPTTPVLTEELIIKNTNLAEVLDNLSLWSDGLIWSIKDLVLSFKPLAVTSAPFNIADSDSPAKTFGEIKRRVSRKTNKNTVIVVGGNAGDITVQQDFFVGDGVTDTFQLKYPIQGPIDPNDMWGVTGAVGFGVIEYGTFPNVDFREYLGYPGATTHPGGDVPNWVYDPVTLEITRLDGPVTNGQPFWVPYHREALTTVTAVDAADVALRGPDEIVLEYPGIIVQAELQRIADAKLAELSGDLDEATYRTHLPGLRIGQVQTIQCADRGLNGNYLVVEVRGRSFEGKTEWIIRAIGGDRFKGSFRDLYAAWLRIGKGGTSSPVNIPPAGGMSIGPGLPFNSLQWNKGGIFGGSEGTNGGFMFHEAGTFSGFSEIRAYPVAAPAEYTRIGVVNNAGDFEIESNGGAQLIADDNVGLLAGIDIELTAARQIQLIPGFNATNAFIQLVRLALMDGLAAKFVDVTTTPFTFNTTTPTDTQEVLALVSNVSGASTINLPPIAQQRVFPLTSFGRLLVIINRNATGTVTVDPDGSETINFGDATLALPPESAVLLLRHTSGWIPLSSFGSVAGGGGASAAGAQGDVQYRGATAGSFDATPDFNFAEATGQLKLTRTSLTSQFKLVTPGADSRMMTFITDLGSVYSEIAFGKEFVSGVDTARASIPSYFYGKTAGGNEVIGAEIVPGETAGNTMTYATGRGFVIDANGRFTLYQYGGLGTGAKTGCIFYAQRNTSGNGAAACFALEDKSGTAYFVWPDDNGVLRISTTPPEEDGTPSDTHGTPLAGTGFNGDGSGNTLTADPASPTNGTWWIRASGTTPTRLLELRIRDAGVTYTIASITV